MFHSEKTMAKKSRLHTPRPHSRPGEAPDFSYLETSPAGAVARPDVNARVRDIGHLAVDLVRVLDDHGVAVGQWNPHLEIHDLQVGLRHMLLTRIFDERMQRVQRQGKISFYMRSLGEEAVSVAQAWPCARATCCSRRTATRVSTWCAAGRWWT
jgi:2-oxoisovalerate dehydrogenase E1 component alpha subunit